MPETAGQLACPVPVLRVNDLAVSLDYYTRKLGFGIDWTSPGAFASISRDACTIFLCEGGQGHAGTWVWIPANSSDLLFAEYRASGALIRQPPTNFPWGSRELQVTDPDGHVLRFASDATPTEPNGNFPPDRSDA